jgi:hypothetical protein
MSYRIVYDIVAVKMPASHFDEPIILVAELGGDNNCYESHGNRRSRDWSARAVGSVHDVISYAAETSAACPGGSLQLHGRYTEPENYIRAYRRALSRAMTLDEASKRGLSIAPIIRLNMSSEDISEIGRRNYAREALQTAGKTHSIIKEYGRTIELYTFDPTDAADMQLWADNIDRHIPWRNAKVSGPDDRWGLATLRREVALA